MESCQRMSALELRYSTLKEHVANQIEMYIHLTETVGPNINARYMMLVGQLEAQVYELQTEANRWKRRLTLRQFYLNRDEKPDLVAIETQLDEEFAEYSKEIARYASKIQSASYLFHASKMSDQEHTALRYAYLGAVKKLHPDLNPDSSPVAVNLWHKIQQAYSDQDWEKVKFLSSLADSVVPGEERFQTTPDAQAELEQACERLKAKSAELVAAMETLQSEVPFIYREFLDDAKLVAERQYRLRMQIAALKECINEYEARWQNGK